MSDSAVCPDCGAPSPVDQLGGGDYATCPDCGSCSPVDDWSDDDGEELAEAEGMDFGNLIFRFEILLASMQMKEGVESGENQADDSIEQIESWHQRTIALRYSGVNRAAWEEIADFLDRQEGEAA